MNNNEDIPNVIVNKSYLESLQKENHQLKQIIQELLQILKDVS